MIITPLILGKVLPGVLEHLNVEFVPPKKNVEVDEKFRQELRQVEEILTTEFGYEVVRRLKLSIDASKVRDLPRN